jgi:hypothetical protein
MTLGFRRLTMVRSYTYLSAACVVSLKMIDKRNKEANRTSENCQDVSAESFGVRKPRVSNLRRETTTSRNKSAMTTKLNDSDKVLGRTVYEFYERRISNSVKVTCSLSEKIYFTKPQGYSSTGLKPSWSKATLLLNL